MASTDEALAVHQTLLHSASPAHTTIKAMKDWFLDASPYSSRPAPRLWGNSVKKYDDEHDLVALRVPADQDRLSEFIINYLSVFFHVYSPNFPLCSQQAGLPLLDRG